MLKTRFSFGCFLVLSLNAYAASFTKAGANTLTLTADSSVSMSGVPTIISAGTLALTGSGAISSIDALTANGTFDISGITTSTTVGSLDGSGTVTLGAKILSTGSAGSTVFAGVIQGVGGRISKFGATTFTLTNTNTYSGTTTVVAGTVALSVGGSITSSAVQVASGATFDITAITSSTTVASIADASDTGGTVALGTKTLVTGDASSTTFSGSITGVGGNLTKQGAGTFSLSGTSNTYSGTTTINAGTLQAAAANAFSPNSAVTIANVASTILDLNGYSTTIPSLAGGGATGGTVTLGIATITLGDTNDTTFAGAITGTGGVTKQGSGIFTLSGTSLNTYSGTTTINVGTVKAGAANAFSSSSTVSLANVAGATLALNNFSNTIANLSGGGSTGGAVTLGSGTLTFGNASSTTFAGTISGSGALVKQGAGQITFSNSATATGGATVSAGAMAVNGSVNTGASNLTVSAGATLKGTGTITAGAVANAGTVSPGNSIGTLHIVGDYIQTGNLDIEFDPTGSDLLDITGSATLSGTLTVTPTFGTYPANTTYIILSSGGNRTGTFSSVINNVPSFQFEVHYQLHSVTLSFNFVPFDQLGLTGNAQIVAQCVESTPDTGDFSTIIDELTFMSLAELQQTLPQMSSSLFNGMDLAEESAIIQVRKSISRELNDLCHTPCDRSTQAHAWADTFYTHTWQDTQGEGTGYSSRPRGWVIGIDSVWTPNVYTGAACCYTRDDMVWKQGQGSARIDSYYGAVYAGGNEGPFYAQIALMGASSRYQATRNVYFASERGYFDAHTRSAWHKKNGWEALGHFETGLSFDACVQLRPYGNVDYLFLYRRPFAETGADSVDLFVQSHYTDLLRFETGIEFLKCLQMRSTKWTPRLTLGAVFERRFVGRNSKASFSTSSCVMDVAGLLPQRTLFLLDAGLVGRILNDRVYLIADYQGEWGTHYYDSTVSVELKIGF